jgi:hypothetical protein
MTTPDDKTALADQRLRRIEALISDRDALRERVAALEAEQDASCNAEELRQTRVDRDALRAEQDALQQVLVDVTAHLVAAHSLLKRGGKKAAGSDKMFTIMLKDYEASIERGRNVVRAALKEGE